MGLAAELGFDQFTSIAPVGLEPQIAALATWHAAHGGPVFTVNHPREVATMAGRLPDWVVPVPVDFAQLYGRDYLPLSALHLGVLAAAHPGHERVVFTNSDIAVAGEADVRALLGTPADLAFASRTDITPEGAQRGLYSDGFDVFALTRPALDALDHRLLRLGMPWWDYVVPLDAILKGHQVQRLDTATFPHQIHAARWSEVAYQDIGLDTLASLAPDLMEGATMNGAKVTLFARYINDILNSEALALPPGERDPAFTAALKADLYRGIANILREPAPDRTSDAYRPMVEVLGPRGANAQIRTKEAATFEHLGAEWRLSRNGASYGGICQIVTPVERGGRYDVEVDVTYVSRRLNVYLSNIRTTVDHPQTVRQTLFAPHDSLTIRLDPAEQSQGQAQIGAIRLRRTSAAG